MNANDVRRTMPLVLAIVGPNARELEDAALDVWPFMRVVLPGEPEPAQIVASVVLIRGGTDAERAACARRGFGDVWKACTQDTRTVDVPGVESVDKLVFIDSARAGSLRRAAAHALKFAMARRTAIVTRKRRVVDPRV